MKQVISLANNTNQCKIKIRQYYNKGVLKDPTMMERGERV